MTTRRSLTDTRALLLDTGAAMLAEQGVPVTLDRITIIDVCRRAGLKTAGSAYKIWNTQEDFRADLLHELLVRGTASLDILDLITETIEREQPATLDDVIRFGAVANLAHLRTYYPTYLALWLACRRDTTLAAAAEAPEAAWLTSFEGFLDALVDHFDREFVPPFDNSALAIALAGLAEGVTIRVRTTPQLLPEEILLPTGPDGADQPWSPLAIGMKAIFDAFTRPRPAGQG